MFNNVHNLILNAVGVQPAPPIQVRLAGGVDKYQGRLEIMYRGVWGTVCDDQFQVPEATVVCRMLGFGSYVTSLKWSRSVNIGLNVFSSSLCC